MDRCTALTGSVDSPASPAVVPMSNCSVVSALPHHNTDGSPPSELPSFQSSKTSGTIAPVVRVASAPNSKVSLPVGRATYNIHFTNHKFWKAAQKEIDKVITEKEGARQVGLLQDDKGSIVKGCEEKYKSLIKIVGSLVKKSSPSLPGFHFTALSITKGWHWTEVITDPDKIRGCIQDYVEPLGERAFITWAEKGSVMVRMDRSTKTNIHGKVLRWDGKAKLKVTPGTGSIYGLYLYNVVSRRSESRWEEEELSSLGFPPPPQAEGENSASEESTTTVEEDPTMDLEPVVVTKKWSEPPPRGSGWWGRGPPIQVHHNYKTKDMVDGGGLCSPGRWLPGKKVTT